MKKENRKLYLLKIALKYLKKIDDSEHGDALGIIIRYDNAECDGSCLIDDIEMELDN